MMKHFGWGIVDADERPYLAPDCVAKDPEYFRQTIEYLNGSEGDKDHRTPQRVVQLFYKELSE